MVNDSNSAQYTVTTLQSHQYKILIAQRFFSQAVLLETTTRDLGVTIQLYIHVLRIVLEFNAGYVWYFLS